MNQNFKVLCFTASSKRPIYLRHCIMQMQLQTYNIHHVLYLNSNEYNSAEDEHNYLDLLSDIPIKKGNQLLAAYGPSASHHRNHMAAIEQVDWQDYDLFFKIDDDDIYKLTYIESAVADFNSRGWDFSGEISKGHILNDKWKKTKDIAEYISDYDYSGKEFMPPTFAWNKTCMEIISKITDIQGSEDAVWRKTLVENTHLKTMVRPAGNFCYNIHKDSILYA